MNTIAQTLPEENKLRVEDIFDVVRETYNLTAGKASKADFYRICEAEDIKLPVNNPEARVLFETDGLAAVLGAFARVGAIKMIYLRCFFQRRFRRDVAFHELGHFFLMHTVGYKLAVGEGVDLRNLDEIQELEADYFAELATGLTRPVR